MSPLHAGVAIVDIAFGIALLLLLPLQLTTVVIVVYVLPVALLVDGNYFEVIPPHRLLELLVR